MSDELIYTPKIGYGIRDNGNFYDFRHRAYPKGKRTPLSDENAIRWFHRQMNDKRGRLQYLKGEKLPVGSAVVFSQNSGSVY